MGAVGVIHRDLKPTNVLMSPTGPKVVDFGISHAADGTALTLTGAIVGSPGWMAPEQARGNSTTSAIDVFAWGATIAFASTGRSPFGEGRPDAILYRVVHEDPDLEGLDPRLGSSVTQALQKEPSARPSADHLLVDLVKTAMAGSLPPGGSIAMATVVLDRTWHQGLPGDTEVGPRSDEPNPRRGMAWLAVVAFILVAALIAGGVFALTHSDSKTSANGTPTTTPPVGRYESDHDGGARDHYSANVVTDSVADRSCIDDTPRCCLSNVVRSRSCTITGHTPLLDHRVRSS